MAWNVFDVTLRDPVQPHDKSWRWSCVFLWTVRCFLTIWCCSSHACRYSGCTRATLRNSLAWVSGHCISHQLMGTIWAPKTKQGDTKAEQRSDASAFFITLQYPCVFRGFYIGLRQCSESLQKKKATYLIHCAPPPPRARFLPSSTGNSIARHRARSNAAVKYRFQFAPQLQVSHTLVVVATVLSLICYSDSRWRIPLLPGQYPQVWSFCTFPPARLKNCQL